MDEFFATKYKIKPKKEDEYHNEEKKINLFSYIHDICFAKKGDLQDKDPELKQFNTYMILQYLSLEEAYLPFINILNQYQSIFTKEQMYKTLLLLVPRGKKFLKYPKKMKQNQKDIDLVRTYYKCSNKEAQEYIRYGFIRELDLKILQLKFGGKEK